RPGPTMITSAHDAAQLAADTESRDADGSCPVCAHAVDQHDALALRFCAATLSRALTRGCLCPKG
ncbi:MAG TPA: RGCVC family protein, partial [Dermatophilaceae bacterium]